MTQKCMLPMRIASMTSGFITDPPMTVTVPWILTIGVTPSMSQGLAVEQKPLVIGAIGCPSTSGRPSELMEPTLLPVGASAFSLLEPNVPAPTVPRQERKLRRQDFRFICSSLITHPEFRECLCLKARFGDGQPRPRRAPPRGAAPPCRGEPVPMGPLGGLPLTPIRTPPIAAAVAAIMLFTDPRRDSMSIKR